MTEMPPARPRSSSWFLAAAKSDYLFQALVIIALSAGAGLAFNQARRVWGPAASPPAAVVNPAAGQPQPGAPGAQLVATPPPSASSGIDFTTDPAKETQRIQKEDLVRQQAAAASLNIGSIGMAEALAMRQSWATFVDARPPDQYASGHIQNAVNLPEATFDEAFAAFQNSAQYVPSSAPLVVYCEGSDCSLSFRIAQKLAGKGYTNVKVYKGGWDEWFAACQKQPDVYPVE